MDITSLVYALVEAGVICGLLRWCFVGGQDSGGHAVEKALKRELKRHILQTKLRRKAATDDEIVEWPRAEYIGYLKGLDQAVSIAQGEKRNGK